MGGTLRAALAGVAGTLALVPAAAQGALGLRGFAAHFDHCPLGTAVPGHRPFGREGVGACVDLVARRGFLRIGSNRQDVTHPVREQFGVLDDDAGPRLFIPPSDGTPWMATSPERVPGGMFGVPLGSSSEVTVTVLPAGPMDFSLFAPTRLALKFKLDNEFLGPHCFIGSDREPIVLRLQPDVAHAQFEQHRVGLGINGLAATDQTFVVPRSNGCNGGELVDAKLGLPSPAGSNAVRLELDAAVASASSVAKAASRRS